MPETPTTAAMRLAEVCVDAFVGPNAPARLDKIFMQELLIDCARALDDAGVAKLDYAARKTVKKVMAMYEIERNEFQSDSAKKEARHWVYAAAADLRATLAALNGSTGTAAEVDDA